MRKADQGAFRRAAFLTFCLAAAVAACEREPVIPTTIDRLRSQTPGARLEVIEGAAHMTMNDRPERSLEGLRRFPREVEGGRQ
jgi:pimeloyl-ACP methyl ester carboxylesterase